MKSENKYSLKYFIFNFVSIFLVASFLSLLFVIVGIIYDKGFNILYFIPLFLALGCMIPVLIKIRFFIKDIEQKEKLYNTKFLDENCVKINSVLYLADEWLINAGRFVIYKNSITSLIATCLRVPGPSALALEIYIKNIEKPYVVRVYHVKNYKKIKNWVCDVPISNATGLDIGL